MLAKTTQNKKQKELTPPAPGRLFVGVFFVLRVCYLVRLVVAVRCVLFICVVGLFGLFLAWDFWLAGCFLK